MSIACTSPIIIACDYCCLSTKGLTAISTSLSFKIHIDVANNETSVEEKKDDVDFFKDQTMPQARAYGDSPTSTPPRVDSGTKLSSLARENGGSGSASPLTVKTDPGKQCRIHHSEKTSQ